jgi:hypothetical protein
MSKRDPSETRCHVSMNYGVCRLLKGHEGKHSKKPRGVTVADLKTAPSDALLRCDECGADYSATHADYFASEPAHVLECCDKPMRLVRRVVRYETVRT